MHPRRIFVDLMAILKSTIKSLALLLLCSCVIFQPHGEWKNEKVGELQDIAETFNDQTTHEVVIDKFGKPFFTNKEHKFVIYRFEKLTAVVAGGGCYPIVFPMAAYDDTDYISLWVHFDDEWKFKEYKLLYRE